MDELIRKKDALDALMAERKHLLDKGRWGAEHVLTHHGYNVIDELKPVQSDVPVINVGDMISKRAATTIPVMPKEHRHYQTNNLDDAYEQGWTDLQECIENLSPVQPEIIRCEDCKYFELDHFEKVDGFPIPIIVAHEICMKWGDGCKSSIDGWCFMAERRTDERTDKQTGGD